MCVHACTHAESGWRTRGPLPAIWVSNRSQVSSAWAAGTFALEPSCQHIFYLSEAEACPFGYTASQQAPGICLSLPTSWVKSAHYYVWFLYVLGIQRSCIHFTHYAIFPSPAEMKPWDSDGLWYINHLLITEKQRNPTESWLFAVFGISCYGDINRHNSFLPKTLFWNSFIQCRLDSNSLYSQEQPWTVSLRPPSPQESTSGAIMPAPKGSLISN